MRDLLAVIKTGRTWQQVADHLRKYSANMWRMIYLRKRHATIEQINIVRVASGLAPLTQSPAQAVADSGVDSVITCSKRPNTALLVAAPAGVVRVRLGIGNPGDDVPATIPITLGYGRSTQRTQRRGSGVIYMDDIAALPPESFKTDKGKTGDLARISAVLLEARQALDYVPTDGEVREWMRTL